MEIKLVDKNKIMSDAINNIAKQIINEIVTECHPKSILFTGSFGRNEPAVVVEESGLKFLSDCEINIVPRKHIPKKTVKKIESTLTKMTGVELAISLSNDLKVYSSFPVPQFISKRIWKPSIGRYDLKYGSRTIYGENCLQNAPDFKPEDIPVWEGIRLMLNRMAEALKYFSIDSYDIGIFKEEQRLIYWISKIIIACQDALLLSIGKYHPSYRIRNNLFQEFFPRYFEELNKELLNFLPLTLKATRYKLNPKRDIYKENVTELWFDTAEICDRVFRYVIKKDMKISFDTYLEFQEKYLSHPKIIRNEYYTGLISAPICRNAMAIFRSYKYLSLNVNIKECRIPWTHIIYSAIPLVYFGLSRNGGIDELLLKQARISLSLFKKIKTTK